MGNSFGAVVLTLLVLAIGLLVALFWGDIVSKFNQVIDVPAEETPIVEEENEEVESQSIFDFSAIEFVA